MSEEAKEGWHDRARLAAAFLRPGDIVCDLGAGSQPLKNYLPEGTKYIPVDCVDTLPGERMLQTSTHRNLHSPQSISAF